MTEETPRKTGARWVPVTSFLREDQARLAAGRLQAEGIPAVVYPEEIGTYYGSAVEALMRHGIDVLVPEDRLLEARELIEALERT
jgi:Putative prokaryotic signal transducing protein